MPLRAGTRLGPYEILAPLGAGGMGEVYRARDISLEREVAIKVLPEDVATDAKRLRRLVQEARAASALNHPNIVTVYGVGEANSVSYVAIELVEGKTLTEMMMSSALSTKKVLEIGSQIADGLAAAHEAGIVHRDLKPANVMLTRDGVVKILDFGLAKKRAPMDSPSISRTVTADTLPGEVVGTAGFMSPEQARGDEVDFRSDQFSLGSLLYELVTGRRAFQGETTIDTLSAVLNHEPEPIARIRPEVPPPLRWTIERCLAKTPAERYQSTRDLARELTSLRDHLSEVSGLGIEGRSAQAAKSRAGKKLASLLAALGLVSIAAVLLWMRARPAAPGVSVRFTISPQPGTAFNFSTSRPAPPALAPDGRTIAFGARDASGKTLLWVRPLNGLAARVLPGTERATYPFWSPDSKSLGFFARGKLMRIDLDGGPPQTICNAPEGRGGSWGSRGEIILAPDPQGSIFRVPATGGQALPVTHLPPGKAGAAHRWPSFLPDGRHFLYLVHDSDSKSEDQGIWVGSVDSSESKRLIPVASNAAYSPPGFLLFAREGALFAVPFDLQKLRLTGEPIPLARNVRYQPYRWNGVFSVSQTGVLVYQTGPAVETSRLVWFDRSGRQIGIVGEAADYEGLRLSPDGSRCAIEVRDARTGTIDIWIGDVARGVTTRLTAGEGINDSPVWSPDGERIVFSSNRSGHFDLYEVASRGGGKEDIILTSEDGKAPTDWAPNGRDIAFHKSGPSTGYRWEIWELSVPDHKVTPLVPRAANQTFARFSPNGAWVAYCSDESGSQEVYVQAAAGGGDKRQISIGGGCAAAWRRDGKEVFYLASDNRLIAVPFKDEGSLSLGPAETLFTARVEESASDIPVFDVSADGRRFLVNTRTEGPELPLTVVVNWRSDRGP